MKVRERQKYFIQEHLLREQLFHGGIGNKQIEEILLKNGYQPIHFPSEYDFSWKAKLKRLLFLCKILAALPGGSSVVFQWPLHARMHVWLVMLLRQLRPSLQIICFLTDINGLKDNDPYTLQNEIKRFKQLDWFIVHNEAMKAWLLQNHSSAKVALLEFFDYVATPGSANRLKNCVVAFAGYLNKSRFVNGLHRVSGITFYLYGSTESISVPSANNVQYKGLQSPESLPMVIEGAFGLLWDGDSIEGLQGVFGDYNRYISPHKLSLYILAGLPIIAHKESGAASLVARYNIGFAVSSMMEIKEAISATSDEQYEKMRKNCMELAESISKGKCLSKALEQIEFMRSSG